MCQGVANAGFNSVVGKGSALMGQMVAGVSLKDAAVTARVSTCTATVSLRTKVKEEAASRVAAYEQVRAQTGVVLLAERALGHSLRINVQTVCGGKNKFKSYFSRNSTLMALSSKQ